jgi:hypothetical protein
MKRNSILALGLGVLLGVGLLGPGCGGSESIVKQDGSADAKQNTGGSGGARTGGTTGAGGSKGAGGAITGGTTGAGGSKGSGGATGGGGVTGTGGTIVVMDGGSDAGLDGAPRDVSRDQGNDAVDVPIVTPDGGDDVAEDVPVMLDGGALDTGADAEPVTLDTAIDESPVDAEAVDVDIEIDTSGLDTGID